MYTIPDDGFETCAYCRNHLLACTCVKTTTTSTIPDLTLPTGIADTSSSAESFADFIRLNKLEDGVGDIWSNLETIITLLDAMEKRLDEIEKEVYSGK